jgi:hypothetical protein
MRIYSLTMEISTSLRDLQEGRPNTAEKRQTHFVNLHSTKSYGTLPSAHSVSAVTLD